MTLRLLLLLTLAAVLPAADHGIRIEASCPWSDPHGYTPVIVVAHAEREVELEVVIGSNGPSARASVRVPAGGQQRQTILVPPSSQTWLSFSALEWSERSGARGARAISFRGNTEVRGLVVDPAQEVPLPALLASLAKVTSASRRSGAQVLERIMPTELPDRWQGYPDWLDEAQRAAIATWARAGGTLVVSSGELLRQWRGRGAHASLDPLTGDAKVLGAAIDQQVQRERWSPTTAPVPGTEAVPVKTFVVLALAFALVVGPLNLWWLGRRDARHLFLVTTPLLSFITCLVLIVASLLADGITLKRSAVQVCYLDLRGQQLVRWTGCSYFAAFSHPVLELDAQTKARVMDPEWFTDHGWGRRDSEGAPLRLDWSQGQRLSGTVLPARLNRQWSFVEVLPERRRLVLEREGTGYRLANGLGAALLGFAWRDGEGRTWTCPGLAAGATAALAPLAPGAGATLALAGDGERSWDTTATLPSAIANRLGPEVAPVCERVRGQAFGFTATLAAPIDVLVGPEGIDVEPAIVIAFGQLPTTGQGAVEAP
jgi:hypothetical protein